MNRECL